jgi:pyridoxal phosphate enzyme (YggS family)
VQPLGDTSLTTDYLDIRRRIDAASQRAGHSATLLAVSKTKPSAAIRALAAKGQHAFGENYVQEALGKQRELADLDLEWHLIGPLQSNKCREVSENFAWLQSLDRAKLIEPLNKFRPDSSLPLNVLIQVNIDDEASKSGCAPSDVASLADRVVHAPRLKLRGLMAIPRPSDLDARRNALRRTRALFEELKRTCATVDTLSMGMSEDFELAIEEGATMVRIGTALFGVRV